MQIDGKLKISAYLLWLLALSASSVSASPLHLTGNWSRPFGDDSDQWQLGQSYNLDLANDITSALRVNGNVRYTTTRQQSGSETKNLSPSILFALNNDLFNLSLNGMQSRRQVDNDPATQTRSWSSTLTSLTKNRSWPRLRLNFNQNFTDNDDNPATIDQKSTSFASGIQQQWSFLSILYDYTRQLNEDNITETKNKNINHSGRIQLQQSFWQQRLNGVVSHKYTTNNNVISTTAAGNRIVRPLLPVTAIAGLDDTPLTDPLSAEAALIDQDTFTPTAIELGQWDETVNVGLQINLENINEIIIYLDREISAATSNRLNWDFYGSLDNVNWMNNLPPATLDYSTDSGRTLIRVRFASTVTAQRYIKAVITSSAGTGTAFITEIEANEITTLNEGERSLSTKSQSHQTQGSITFRPSSRWQLSYHFNRNETLPDQSLESLQLSNTLSSSLDWNRFFAIAASISESSDTIEDKDEIKNRSYALSYRANPLNSLSFSLGTTHTERLEDNLCTNRSDTWNSHLSATLYPDLTASISANVIQSDEPLHDTQTTSKEFKLNLAARFTASFNLALGYTYHRGEEGDPDHEYLVNAIYRPSPYVSLTSGYTHSRTNKNLYSILNLRLTPKIQSDFRYGYTAAETTLHSAGCNLTWHISSVLNLRQAVAWSKDESEHLWSGLTSLNYNF